VLLEKRLNTATTASDRDSLSALVSELRNMQGDHLGATPADDKINELERKLAVFDQRAGNTQDAAQDNAIAAIQNKLKLLTTNLNDLTYAARQKNALADIISKFEQTRQAAIVQAKLAAATPAPVPAPIIIQPPKASVTKPAKVELPGDFAVKLQIMLEAAKETARKYYEDAFSTGARPVPVCPTPPPCPACAVCPDCKCEPAPAPECPACPEPIRSTPAPQQTLVVQVEADRPATIAKAPVLPVVPEIL